MIGFNVGVEIGQRVALADDPDRVKRISKRTARLPASCGFATNAVVMACGFLLVGYQLSGYFLAVRMTYEHSAQGSIRNRRVPTSRRGGRRRRCSSPAFLLVTCVLPAGLHQESARHRPPGWGLLQYGRRTGKQSRGPGSGQRSSLSAAAGQPVIQVAAGEAKFHEETVEFKNRYLAPAWNTEYRLEKGESLLYSWKAPVPVNYELHAEPDGGPRGYAQSYENRSTAALKPPAR